MLSAGLLLRWLSDSGQDDRFKRAAEGLRTAVEGALRDGRGTPDLGRVDSTTAFSNAVIERIP